MSYSEKDGQVIQCSAIVAKSGRRCKLPAMREENAEYFKRLGVFDSELCEKHQTALNVRKIEAGS
jgi:hypothetical protein